MRSGINTWIDIGIMLIIRIIAHVLLIDNLLITSLIPILLFEYFKEKS
jgi:hypothetical protein